MLERQNGGFIGKFSSSSGKYLFKRLTSHSMLRRQGIYCRPSAFLGIQHSFFAQVISKPPHLYRSAGASNWATGMVTPFLVDLVT
jgi:hypothetical protein